MTKNDYVFVRTAAELHSIAGAKRTLGLFYAGPMLKVTEGRSPSLSAMTHYALRALSDAPEGFFLMVEGSQIDFGGHANDLDYVITETTDFDESIGEVFRFLNDHGLQKETLVLITGDHETGGLSLNPHPRLPLSYQPKWTTDGHTGVAVPVFSYGAGSAKFKGIQTHSDIGRKLIEGMTGWTIDWEYPGSQR
jgi:alkaline phosphatase